MIQEFVDRWESRKGEVKAIFESKHPENYKDVVAAILSILTKENEYPTISARDEHLHLIDDGDYQGTLLFIIAEDTYQPHSYWFVKVYYGSCSGCDTLQAIRGWDDGLPTPEQVDDYMTLALHIIQELKKLGDD